MASLEYLTQNSLTAYPFKGRLPSSAYREHPIQDDWFYDILFVSYSKEIYRVYISKIESGSIITHLVDLFPIAIPFIENSNTIVEFTKHLKGTFDYFLGRGDKKQIGRAHV